MERSTQPKLTLLRPVTVNLKEVLVKDAYVFEVNTENEHFVHKISDIKI